MRHKIVIIAEIEPESVFGLKECIAMYLEQVGVANVVSIQPVPEEQTRIRKDVKNGRGNH